MDIKPLSLSRHALLRAGTCGESFAGGSLPHGVVENLVNARGQLFDAKGFGKMRQTAALKERLGRGGDDVAGDEQKTVTQRIAAIGEALVKMLPVESGHFHVADDQVEGFLGRAFEGFPTVEKHIDEKAFVLEHVGNQARDGRFIFNDQHAGLGSHAIGCRRPRGGGIHGDEQRVAGHDPSRCGCSHGRARFAGPVIGERPRLRRWQRGGRGRGGQPFSHGQFHGKNRAAFCAAQHVHATAMLANDAEALQVAEVAGKWMGRGLALLIDALNPQVIVFGSLGVALGERVLGPARRVIAEEALPQAAAACQLVPSALGKQIGDVAALMAALTDHSIRSVLETGF